MRTVTRQDILQRKKNLYQIFCSKLPVDIWVENTDNYFSSLQDFVCDNLRDDFSYATAYSVINAIDDIVISQIENGDEQLSE
jgi:hypothetical protein